MRFWILLCAFPLLVLTSSMHLNQAAPEGEWHFAAIHNGVKFYWREDPSWHFLEIKAENSSVSYINYEYGFTVWVGTSAVYSGKNQWVRLRSRDKNIIRISKEFQGITRVKLENIKVERYS
ncbi:MAG TPA: hypothetical protein DIW47_00100 [Bacteroidetes bacterium]|nr:hypothetical protein [Bacteroidota bacterium]